MHMCFCVLLYFTACMLYYCNTVGWAWWDWGLIWWLTVLLQCFDTVGWVTWPVKISSPNDLYCVEWDVKPYSTTTCTVRLKHSNVMSSVNVNPLKGRVSAGYTLLFCCLDLSTVRSSSDACIPPICLYRLDPAGQWWWVEGSMQVLQARAECQIHSTSPTLAV